MNGLLICKGTDIIKNIGDDIQSLAQEQFFEHIDCFVEREHIDTFSSKEKTNLIMNAWWMFNPENFPPSESINPLFVSFHIVPDIAERMLSTKTIDYLKKYEPIGCRDIETKERLESLGIKAYFSGCLTLTLGLKYKEEKHSDNVIFVDPYYEVGGVSGCSNPVKFFNAVKLLLKHYSKVRQFRHGFNSEFMRVMNKFHLRWFANLLACASFYEAYSKSFADEVLFNATYINHNVTRASFKNMKDRIDFARSLLKKYAQAKLVVTSRIHCALPCLGIETPVIFVNAESLKSGKLRSGGRFSGNLELLNIMEMTDNGIIPSEELKKQMTRNKIDTHSTIVNSNKYKALQNNLISTVTTFIKKNQ